MSNTRTMCMDVLLEGKDRIVRINKDEPPVAIIKAPYSTENGITNYYHIESCDDIFYDIQDALTEEEQKPVHFPYREILPCAFRTSIKKTAGCVSCKTPLFTGGRFPTITMRLWEAEYRIDTLLSPGKELYALVRTGDTNIACIVDRRTTPHLNNDGERRLYNIYLSRDAAFQDILASIMAQCYAELLTIKGDVRIRTGKREDTAKLEEACTSMFH